MYFNLEQNRCFVSLKWNSTTERDPVIIKHYLVLVVLRDRIMLYFAEG